MQQPITQVRNFSKEHDYTTAACRLHNHLLNSPFRRNHWVCIEKVDSSERIFRQPKGLVAAGFTQESLELDYDSRLELGISGDQQDGGFIACDLTIRQTSWFESWILANWHHPDHTHRVASRYALFGLGLGALGFLNSLL